MLNLYRFAGSLTPFRRRVIGTATLTFTLRPVIFQTYSEKTTRYAFENINK